MAGSISLAISLASVRFGGTAGAPAPALLGPAPAVALTSAPTAYPPTLSLAFLGGVEEIGDTVTLKRFTNPASLTVWPDLSAPTVSQTFTLTSTVAVLQAQINAALASISTGTGLIYLTHTPQGGSESYHSFPVLYGTAAAPTLITNQSLTQVSDVQMDQRITFSMPVTVTLMGDDAEKLELRPVKPNGQVATDAEMEFFARSPIWSLRWMDNVAPLFDYPNYSVLIPHQWQYDDLDDDKIFRFGYDAVGANGVSAYDLRHTDPELTKTQADSTPLAPSWADISNAALQAYTSGNWTLSGLEPSFVFTSGTFTAVNGATYTKNGVSGLTASPFSYTNGDVFSIEATPTASGALSRGTLVMGGTSATFGAIPDNVSDAGNFTAQLNAALNTAFSSNTITFTNIGSGFNFPATISLPAGWSYTLNGTAGLTASSFTYQLGNTLSIQGTSSADPATSLEAVVTLADGATRTYSIATTAALDPPNQAGLLLRLDGYDLASMSTALNGTGAVTANGQTVGSIMNKAPSGTRLSAENDARRPTIAGIGTFPAINFAVDRANIRRTNGFGIIDRIKANAFTFVFSCNFDAAGNGRTLFCERGLDGSSNPVLVEIRRSALTRIIVRFVDSADVATNVTLETAPVDTVNATPRTYCVDFDGTTWRLYVDKVLRASSTTAVPAFLANTTASLGTMGAGVVRSTGFTNTIDQHQELIHGALLFNSRLSDADRNANIEWAAFAYTGTNV